ncbi:transglycosylase domain-containing protein [Oleisolibacter albus]|uniref:transglycosylase domain-containing protein n=1 Tax=Oleisolibacter albus TaxID=2171757 RepID=UPI001EFDB51F|nr:transglycosylase domain-containing protein [Oleisolibacter albus]
MAWGLTLALVAGGGGAAWYEMKTSRVQAEVLTRLARDMTYAVKPGPNPFIVFPGNGPYDQRLGYNRIPQFIERLTATGYRVSAQARPSPAFRDYVVFGGFPPYREKTSGGLTLHDRSGAALFDTRYPQRTYHDFAAVPTLVANTLLFIENRELLDATYPTRNPAVEWDRFALAVANIPLKFLDPDNPRAGGSTLATQIEKYRHSPEGRTSDGVEKLRQMMSASVRAYLGGPDTSVARHQILVDYLNSTPLSARPGIGEVNGIGDGLWAWFGTDFHTANRILRGQPRTEEDLQLQAVAYKQVLSLLLAQRRPSYYLAQNRKDLDALANQHLRVLEQAGVISPALADAAQNFPLRFRNEPPVLPEPSFIEAKATNAIRSRLLSLLGVSSLYELDRLDLTADSTLDQPTQERVTAMLRRLADPVQARELGLVGDRLLNDADPAKVVYSVTLYERTPTANLVRVQVDTLDQPLDLNEGAKLDLGSTAKLRTLATYLEIIAKLHGRLQGRQPFELSAIAADADDRLTEWAARTMAQQPGIDRATLLELAMQRQYSANPGERFFTGGGMHSFGNFDDKDDGKVMPLAEGFRHSVNLVFIRLMRDVVNHFIAEGPSRKDDVLDDPRHPARKTYLAQFADKEGQEFLNRFWGIYKAMTPDQALDMLAQRVRKTPDKLSTAFRSARPQATVTELGQFLARHLPGGVPEAGVLKALYDKYAPDAWSLNDRGYIAGVHPLELWLVAYLQDSPKPKHKEMMKESSSSRQESYEWLFTTRHKRAQDSRIGIVLETEAFERIHTEWKRLGYPFDSLIPSYATSIGSSADRPGALADLMGIIVNDGVRLPTARITRLHFAQGTPYETEFALRDGGEPGMAEQVMDPEVARTLRRHLMDIVENGTARRVKGAFTLADGTRLPIGGKTGTGDQRFERYGPGGVVLESRVVNRTATFVFYIGDRFFGVITAHVHGPEAAKYRFTSALPSQLLKIMAPALQPLIDPGAVTVQQQPEPHPAPLVRPAAFTPAASPAAASGAGAAVPALRATTVPPPVR